MDEGMKMNLENNSNETIATKKKKKSFYSRLKRAFTIIVVLMLCSISACQVHYYMARRTPAVSGKVVDIETGQPIAGADVMVVIHGFPSDPAAAVASSGVFIAGGDLKTDSEGKFLFASQTPRIKDSGTTLMSYIFWGPEKQIGIEVNVFSKEHMTAASKTEGLDWKEDPFFEIGYEGKNGDRLVRVSRKKQLKGEYQYLIETKKAVTEKEWQLKCHDTLLSCHDPEQKGDEWLFNDLVGYLERFPDGEKAGEYLKLAWQGNQILCPNCAIEEYKKGNLTKEQLNIDYKRACKLIQLEEKNLILAEGAKSKANNTILAHDKERAETVKSFMDSIEKARGKQ